MKIISFASTTPALVLGHKSVTRREWEASYAKTFRQGEQVAAWNRSPRFNGNPVATIRIVSVELQNTRDMPDSDYEAEGFNLLKLIGAKIDGMTPDEIWRSWRELPRTLYVVRFDSVVVEPRILRLYEENPLRKDLD